jgi:hypothetical protein
MWVIWHMVRCRRKQSWTVFGYYFNISWRREEKNE